MFYTIINKETLEHEEFVKPHDAATFLWGKAHSKYAIRIRIFEDTKDFRIFDLNDYTFFMETGLLGTQFHNMRVKLMHRNSE